MLTARSLKPPPDVETAQSIGTVESGLPFEPLTLIFRNLRYFVPAPKGSALSAGKDKQAGSEGSSKDKGLAQLELLKSLTGYAAPGVLTALMGGSGQPACKLYLKGLPDLQAGTGYAVLHSVMLVSHILGMLALLCPSIGCTWST